MSANILRHKVWMRTRATTSRQRARLQIQPLEPRDVPAATLAVDFNTNSSPTAPNFMGDRPGLYSPGVNHMGWQNMTGMAAMDRATTNPLTRDFQYGKDGTFLADSLPQGTYNVVIGLGDASAVRDLMSVWAQGQQLAANVTTKSGQALEIRGRVVVGADGMFTLHLVDGGGKSPNFALDYLTLTPDDPNATGLWPADAKPAGTGSVSSQGAELGLKFQSDVSGFVTGIRFYKGTGNTGTHTGSLWSADGTRLATATFSGESASGWQTVTFATPVAIQANTTYVASYHSPTGKDSVNLDYFTISGLTNGHLMVLPGPLGGGGVYCRGSGFPTNTNRSSNYWVDVVFASGAGPSANAGPDQSANEGSAVSFAGTAGGGTGTLTFDWDFGDGSAHGTGSLTPTHKYADNGTYTVTLTVTDANNVTASDTAVVTVANVAPTATFSNNGPVAAGTSVPVQFSNQSDPSVVDTSAGFTYSYDFNNDGTWDVTDSTVPVATTTFGSAGTYTVKGRIKDKDGGFTDYTTAVTVTGPLSANAGPDQSANEGSAVSFAGTAGGGTGALTYDWDFGDGSAHGTGSLTPTHKYADNGTYTVTLTVTDANNVTASDTAVVTVANVAPTATFSNNGPVTAGSTVTLSFTSPSDPSTADTAAGFKYSYDFNNDGTWDVADSANSSATTSFAAAGTYTVKGRIKDKDGGSTTYSTTVTVNNPSSGLVGDFQFNEGSGTTTASGVGGLTGTISNATWVTGGHTGGALSFNGSNSVVTVPDAAGLDLTTGMTLEAWVKPSVVGSWESVVMKERTNGLVYAMYGSNNAGNAAGYLNTGGSDANATGSTNPPLNTWTHLAVTYDGANLRLYTNGALTTTTAHTGSLVTSTGNLVIGGNSIWGEYFNGLIDEVRVYNRALTAAEIQSDMNAAPTVTAVSPANGATGIATTAAVKVTFSKAMDPATMTSTNVQLKTSGGSVVSASVTYDSTSQTATLTPSAALTKAATYTVVVHSGAGGVADSTGKLMATDFTSSFTTTDGSPPTANAGPDQSANEGSAVSFAGTAGGGTGALTYDWDFGDGSSHGTGSLAPTHKYADNGAYTVTLTVTDANNVTASDTAVVTVANVAPTATLSNGGPVTVNASVAITFTSPSDPSTADTAAGFKYSYDFNNDGTWDVADSANSSATTSFAAAGTYTVKGRIKDKDGGSTTYSTTVTVNNPSSGHTYYVSSTGSDTANGSSATPFKTIQHAADLVAAGDTVIVRAGNYTGFIMGWDSPTAGTASNPITFEADPNATPGTVVINGKNAQTYYGIDLEPGCDYITLSGFTVDGSGGITSYPNKGGGIKVTGDNDAVLGNVVTNIDYGFGIVSNFANSVRIENNTITHTGSHGDVNQGHGIYVAGDCTGARVVGNVIHDNDYIGLHINGDPGNVNNALIANNLIYNNGQNAINADGLRNSTIQNNLLYGFARSGIVLYQANSSAPSTGNVIENNTIVSTVSGAAAAIVIRNGATGNQIRNNILLGGGGVSIRISNDSLTGFVSDYNVAGPSFQNDDTGSTMTLAQWRTTTGQDAHSITATAATLFVNSAGNDYHLSATSPAIDHGTTTSAPATDLDGNSRPHGAGIDIGAYEYVG